MSMPSASTLLPSLLTGFFLFTPSLVPAQDPVGAKALVEEGVELHDEGKYKDAIKKYDKALKLDQDNLEAMAEKAMTLNALGEHEAGAALCQEIIEKHNGAREAPIVYVTYGNCMDQMGRPEASLKVYDKGISVLPYMAMLHFNKGITLSGMGPDSAASALKCFERSARLDPFHPGTQNAMGRLLAREDRNIPATLVMCRFLILEPEGARAKDNQALLQRLLKGNVKQNANGSTEIRVDASMVRDSTDTVHVANDFRSEELTWSLGNSLFDVSELTKMLNDAGLQGTVTVEGSTSASGLKDKLDMLAGLLLEGRARNHGFLWEYHGDWMIAVKDAGHTEAVAYLANASTDDKEVKSWLKENGEKIGAYYAWEKDYSVGVLKEKH
jgi:Tfp pilus assembly protein PilF